MSISFSLLTNWKWPRAAYLIQQGYVSTITIVILSDTVQKQNDGSSCKST